LDNEAYNNVSMAPRDYEPPSALDVMRSLTSLRERAYSYLHVAGNTFTPRTSTMEWRYPGSGGIYATSWDHFLPFLRK
jgi:hypothetical protein